MTRWQRCKTQGTTRFRISRGSDPVGCSYSLSDSKALAFTQKHHSLLRKSNFHKYQSPSNSINTHYPKSQTSKPIKHAKRPLHLFLSPTPPQTRTSPTREKIRQRRLRDQTRLRIAGNLLRQTNCRMRFRILFRRRAHAERETP